MSPSHACSQQLAYWRQYEIPSEDTKDFSHSVRDVLSFPYWRISYFGLGRAQWSLFPCLNSYNHLDFHLRRSPFVDRSGKGVGRHHQIRTRFEERQLEEKWELHW